MSRVDPAGHRREPQPQTRGDGRRAGVAAGAASAARAGRRAQREIMRRKPDRASPAPAARAARRTAGASHGSGVGSGGQLPSLSPPRTITSACCSRASSRPQMKIRGCPPKGAAHRLYLEQVAKQRSRIARIERRAAAAAGDCSSRVEQRGGGAPVGTRARPGRPRSPARRPARSRRARSQSVAGGDTAAAWSASTSAATARWPGRRRAMLGGHAASSPARPARGRGPRKARSRSRTWPSQSSRASSPCAPTSGCLSKRQQCDRREILFGQCAASASNSVPAGFATAAGRRCRRRRSPSASSCGRDPRGEGAVGRDQGRGLARRLERLAQRESRSPAPRRRDRPVRYSECRSAAARAAASRAHLSVKAGGGMALAMARPRTAGDAPRPPPRQVATSARATPIAVEQALEMILRMAFLAAPVLVGAERVPFMRRACFRQRQAGQHHRAFAAAARPGPAARRPRARRW